MHDTICYSCRLFPICPLSRKESASKCDAYLPFSLQDTITPSSIREYFSISVKEKKMEAPELVEKSQAEIAKNAWKERLKEEYAQLKERYEKLKAYNNTQEVELNIADKTQTAIEHYRYRLLDRQQRAMSEYLHILELRAVLESIDLN